MNRILFWKLAGIIAAGTVCLFYWVDWLADHAESRMSHIDLVHQQTLLNYQHQAIELQKAGKTDQLSAWLHQLQIKEKTWAAIVESELTPRYHSQLLPQFSQSFALGRNVEWKVHLSFNYRPIIDLRLNSPNSHLLVQLPESMMPGSYLRVTHLMLKVAIPLLFLLLISVVLYRHLMQPIRQLDNASKAIMKGNWQVKASAGLDKRNDELSSLAATFDAMASRVGAQLLSQRQFIADFSHELRTPLARIETAIACSQHQLQPEQMLKRISDETQGINRLAEDMLSLAWFESEQPCMRSEALDLVDLLDVLVEDARFEYASHQLIAHLPASAPISATDGRLLGQAIENVLRNALKYSPLQSCVVVSLYQQADEWVVEIADQGPGVKPDDLDKMFEPFVRLDNQSKGFGLGLALVKRQLTAVGARIYARNNQTTGLTMSIGIPASANR